MYFFKNSKKINLKKKYVFFKNSKKKIKKIYKNGKKKSVSAELPLII